MTENNGWPGKPGVPLNPERDGWHWLQERHPWSRPEPVEWCSKPGVWRGKGPPEMAMQSAVRYIAPVLTPAEVDARVKEEAARLIKQTADVLSNPSAKDSLNYVANAILALKDEGNE
jgi:hypothetical protein